MNHINILKRALHITVNYRVLWIFGMVLALTTGGSGGGNGGSSGGGSSNGGQSNFNGGEPFTWENPFQEMPQFPQITTEVANTLIGVGIALACLVLVLIAAGTIARYVAETSVIRMVDEHEKSGAQLTFRQGFGLGWARPAWHMFLMDLVVGLAFFAAFLILLALAALPLLVWLTDSSPLQVLGSVLSAGLGLLVLFALIVAGLGMSLVMLFARRACALEGLGVGESLRRGFGLVKARLGDLLLMGVIMFGIGLLWVLVSIPVILAVVVAAALFGGLPALLVGSIVGLFTGGATPWIVGAAVGIPLFIVAVVLPAALVGGWQKIFSSSAWTLTYRELLALEQTQTNGELPAPA